MDTQRFVVEIKNLDPYNDEFTTEHLVDAIEVGMKTCGYGDIGVDYTLEVT